MCCYHSSDSSRGKETLGVVEYGLLWFTILAAPWLARIKGHVFIDAVAELLSPGARKVTSKLAYLVVIIGSLMLAWFSLELAIESYVDEAIDERSIGRTLVDLCADAYWVPPGRG